MGEFIGKIEPLYGRWHWPLRAMKPGDWFLVDKTLRKPEDVRNMMSVRAAQLGIRLSVTKHPEDHPGYTKVEMVDLDKPIEKPDGMKLDDYEVAAAKLEEWYGFDINAMPYGNVYGRGEARINAPQIAEPPVRRIIFNGGERDKLVGLVFDVQGFTAYALPKAATLDSWKLAPSLDDVMS